MSNDASRAPIPSPPTDDPTVNLLRQMARLTLSDPTSAQDTIQELNNNGPSAQLSRRRFICTQCVSLTLGLFTCFALLIYAIIKNDEVVSSLLDAMSPNIECKSEENLQSCLTREAIEELILYFLKSNKSIFFSSSLTDLNDVNNDADAPVLTP